MYLLPLAMWDRHVSGGEQLLDLPFLGLIPRFGPAAPAAPQHRPTPHPHPHPHLSDAGTKGAAAKLLLGAQTPEVGAPQKSNHGLAGIEQVCSQPGIFLHRTCFRAKLEVVLIQLLLFKLTYKFGSI